MVAVLLWLSATLLGTAQTSNTAADPAADTIAVSETIQDNDLAALTALIRQLGADDFATRQAASLRLLEIGAPAIEALKSHLGTDDPELHGRIQALLVAIRMKVPFDAAYTISDVLSQFESMSEYDQQVLLRGMAGHLPLEFVFDFLQEMPDESVALQRQQAAFPLAALLTQRALAQPTSQVLDLLRHPFVQRHYTALSFRGLKLMGQANAEAERWLARAADSELSDTDLVVLTVALQVVGRNAEARKVLEQIGDLSVLQKQLDNWELQQGNWEYFWEQLAASELPRPEQVLASSVTETEIHALLRRLTMARLTNREQDYAAARDIAVRLLLTADAESDEEKPRMALLMRGLLLNGEVLKVVAATRQAAPLNALQIANYAGLHSLAREILEIPEDVAERWKWMNTKVNEFRNLERQYSSAEDSIGAEVKIIDLHSLLIEASEHLATVGLKTDATVLLELLLSKMDPNDYQSFPRRQNIIQALARLQAEDFWKTVTTNFSENSYQLWYLQSTLFSSRPELANFWYNRVRDEKILRDANLNWIAVLMNDPLAVFPEDFDLDAVVDKVNRSPSAEREADKQGDIHFNLGLTYFAHGRWSEYQAMLETAVSQYQHQRAAWYLGRDAFDEQRWSQAIEYLKLAVKSEINDVRIPALLMLSRAYRETGDAPRAADARLAAFFACQVSLSPGAVLELTTYGFGEELATFDLGSFSNAHAWAGTDDQQSARWTEIHLVETLQSPTFASVSLVYPLGLQRNAIARRAAALSAQNLPEEAEQLILAQGTTLLSYGSLCEKLIAAMEQRGQVEVAERIFNRQAEWFIEQLKQFPNNNTLLNSFAWTCVGANRRLAEATYCSERSLVLRPRLKHYMDTLAALYYRQGRHAEAIELTRACMMLDPDYAHYRRQLQKFLSESADQTEPAVFK
jgi:tetratricopeptide (TPR) repeat protein